MSEANADNKQFAIQKIYVKDISFETVNTPTIFTEHWEPEISLNLNTKSKTIGDDTFEVVLKITVTAKQGDNTAYLAEVQQAGIFTMAGFADEEIKPMLGAFCPNTLYPFARETVADLVQRGGFPPLLLAPINFDALYAQQQRETDAQSENPTTSPN